MSSLRGAPSDAAIQSDRDAFKSSTGLRDPKGTLRVRPRQTPRNDNKICPFFFLCVSELIAEPC